MVLPRESSNWQSNLYVSSVGLIIPKNLSTLRISVLYTNNEMQSNAITLASKMRQRGLLVDVDLSGKSLKKQMELSINSKFTIIVGPKEYEQNNFGEVTTDLSCSESVANMLAYILGEEILFNNDTYNLFTRFHNEYLTEEKKNLLIDSLKES